MVARFSGPVRFREQLERIRAGNVPTVIFMQKHCAGPEGRDGVKGPWGSGTTMARSEGRYAVG